MACCFVSTNSPLKLGTTRTRVLPPARHATCPSTPSDILTPVRRFTIVLAKVQCGETPMLIINHCFSSAVRPRADIRHTKFSCTWALREGYVRPLGVSRGPKSLRWRSLQSTLTRNIYSRTQPGAAAVHTGVVALPKTSEDHEQMKSSKPPAMCYVLVGDVCVSLASGIVCVQ